MRYDRGRLLSYNKLFNFVNGNRGGWKTVENWVNVISDKMEVGDAIQIDNDVTIVSCLDGASNKIRAMRTVSVFDNQQKIVAPVGGTFNNL